MTKPATLLSFVFSLFLFSVATAQTNKIAEQKIDSIFASYNAQSPGVAVAIVKDGKIIFKKGYGMADLNHNIPITPQTIFNIASVSKQFTAFTIYLLQDEGKLTLNDDVRKYIPELPDYGSTIRIKHLLAHTSGLRDQSALGTLAGYHLQTNDQILKFLCRQKGVNYAPGTTLNYSNTGYVLLAEIVERITGKSFAAYTSEKIFVPLGMTSTQFMDNYAEVVKNKAESYERVNNEYEHRPLTVSHAGPSNLLTTVEDLAKWVLNFEEPVVGNKKLIMAFNEVSYFDNGKKVMLRVIEGDTIFHAKGQNRSHHKGARTFSHGGHTAAFRTYLGRFPDQRLAIIQLSNDEHNERLGGRWNLTDYYIKDQLKEVKPGNSVRTTAPAAITETYTANLKDFEGSYYSDELEVKYQLVVIENALVLKSIRLDDLELKRTGDYKFSGSGPEVFLFEINFTRNEAGAITGFDISNFGVKNLKFIKLS